MIKNGIIESIVGFFILAGILALFLLAFKISGLHTYSGRNAIKISAMFDNIGDLKERAPVKIAGVKIGEIASIYLDKKSYRAKVIMLMGRQGNNLPVDSSASILSTSLLGSNYISIDPGYSEKFIKDGGEITDTHPAIILENLIGEAIFTTKKGDEK